MYRIRVCIGSLISLVCLGFALYALYQLIRGGSCASGGNYVSARECPPGTEKWAWILPGAIIGGLLSFFLGVFKGFGPAPTDRTEASSDPATRLGGRVIVTRGQVFPRGETPHSWQMFTPGQAPPGQAPTGPVDGRDPIVRLQRLRELLDAGTLSPAEFERAKAKILSEM
ncbi:SHOCT domain-containing protein [Sphaerisporangium album]|uniref:SHOCT domain-containing protein n=1 Tax=Sphaerisporangium album TaxID=509200 RepID=A0A367ESC7_9ACTN|nr:SHOCT domain-containing protein [Sphaerisporangium album]RCG20090.1 SHOCT domain-containing protein [Sphaerisporangium album]